MRFINRKKEVISFQNNYEIYTRKNISQVYIVEAEHGVGKSEFIRKISNFFTHSPLDIIISENIETYIQQLLDELGLQADNLDSNLLTIKFHNNEIDEDIPILLNNAKITAYDEYDKFAINNNLLVYYILSNNISNLECQKVVNELEEMLIHTNFKRFIDKIYYNLYHYYIRMFNLKKSNYYKEKLTLSNIDFDDNYNYQLIYETSWKLPIDI